MTVNERHAYLKKHDAEIVQKVRAKHGRACRYFYWIGTADTAVLLYTLNKRQCVGALLTYDYGDLTFNYEIL